MMYLSSPCPFLVSSHFRIAHCVLDILMPEEGLKPIQSQDGIGDVLGVHHVVEKLFDLQCLALLPT